MRQAASPLSASGATVQRDNEVENEYELIIRKE